MVSTNSHLKGRQCSGRDPGRDDHGTVHRGTAEGVR